MDSKDRVIKSVLEMSEKDIDKIDSRNLWAKMKHINGWYYTSINDVPVKMKPYYPQAPPAVDVADVIGDTMVNKNITTGDYLIRPLFDSSSLYWLPKETYDKLRGGNSIFVLFVFILGLGLGLLFSIF